MSPSLKKKLDQLPPEYLEEVENFVSAILEKKIHKKNKKLKLSWAGGLREYRDQFTSLELQKKSLEWWTQ